MFTQGSMAMPTPTTGGTATPEYFEVEDERQSATAPTTQWPPQQQQPQEDQMQVSPTGTAVDAAADAAPPPRNAPPMQKRRRVTRACDECRRKKIKCDGKQPCTHCTVYSYGNITQWDLCPPDYANMAQNAHLTSRRTAVGTQRHSI